MCHPFIANRRSHVRPGSSGTVVPGYEAKLIDDSGREVAVGEVGNLMVKGDSACSCYWNQHERTKQTIEGEWVRRAGTGTRGGGRSACCGGGSRGARTSGRSAGR